MTTQIDEPPTPIDLTTLMRRCSDNSELVLELIRRFQLALPNYFDTVNDDFGEGDLQNIQFQSHKLKGSAATLAAEGITTESSRLNNAAKSGDLDGARTAYHSLLNEIDIFLTWADEILPTLSSNSNEP